MKGNPGSDINAPCPLLKEVPLKIPSATRFFPFSTMQHETEHMKLVLWYLIKLNGNVFMILKYAFTVAGKSKGTAVWDFVFIPLFIYNWKQVEDKLICIPISVEIQKMDYFLIILQTNWRWSICYSLKVFFISSVISIHFNALDYFNLQVGDLIHRFHPNRATFYL